MISKIQKSGVVRLDKEARTSVSVMIQELLEGDPHLKINHSKIASFIITDYHCRYFDKAKPRLTLIHQDKRKCLLAKIENLDMKELEATIKYLDKIKKDESTEENS